MGFDRIHTGSEVFNELLKGGFERSVVTTVYGPAGSGKTNVCLLAATQVAPEKTVVYIDTEGGFSIARLEQLDSNYLEYSDNIMIFKPTTFEEQKNVFEKLRGLIQKDIGMIIVDSIAMLYRLELGKSNDVYNTNKDLGVQIAQLTEIARKNNIPILITNQVYANFDVPDQVSMVGGDILKYGSKCLIELEKAHKQTRVATIRKHRSLPEGRNVIFNIEHTGFSAFVEETGQTKDKPEAENDVSFL